MRSEMQKNECCELSDAELKAVSGGDQGYWNSHDETGLTLGMWMTIAKVDNIIAHAKAKS